MPRSGLGPLLLMVSLCSCATVQQVGQLNTPSGRPEVEIPGVTKKQVETAILAREMERGWDLKTQTDAMLVFSKRTNDFGAMLLYGSRYDVTPEGRLKFTLVEVPTGVRVFLKVEIITNPGSAFERVTEVVSQKDLEGDQVVLEEIRDKLLGTVKREDAGS